MKNFKTTLWLLAVVASVSCFTSCKKEKAGNGDSDKYVEFDATIEQGFAYANGSAFDQKLVWKDGASVSVFPSGTSTNSQFDVASRSGANARFRAVLNTDFEEALAVSPYHAENNKLSSGDLSCIVPSIQYAVAGNVDSDALLMVASCKKGQTATFKNACAMVKFTAGAEFQSFSITTNNKENIAGTAVVKVDAQGTPTATASGTNSVILRNTIKKGNVYYIVVAPTTLSKGLTISATIDGKLYSKTIDTQNYQFKRNVITDLGTVQFNTSDGGTGEGSGSSDIVVNYETEDLGLPSKKRWATVNVGAISPVDPGLYFQWGDPVGYTRDSGHSFAKNNYKFYDKAKDALTKYNSTDKKTTVDKEDDAATVNWNEDWRMPTQNECKELIENCYWEWTYSYCGTGASGYIVYKVKNNADKNKLKNSIRHDSTVASYNEKDTHIFIPATGYFSENQTEILYEEDGFYWTATLTPDETSNAIRLYIYNNTGKTLEKIGAEAGGGYYRYTGRCVRPVYCGK